MSLFNGIITIFQGGRASGFANLNQSDTTRLADSYMLQIKSYGSLNIKAVQVEYKARNLNSNDVFIVVYTNKSTQNQSYYIWCGKGSTGDEREAAKTLLLAQKKEPEMVIESQERDEFWQALDGKQAYNSEKRLQYASHAPIARLFEVSNASGKIQVNEIYQFTQDDLNTNDVMILDAWDTIFIWVGSNSNKMEREESERIVFDYLKSDPSQRGTDLPIFKVKQGIEPPIFTGFFGPWDNNIWNAKVSANDYFSIKQDLQSKNQPHLYQLTLKDKNFGQNGASLGQNRDCNGLSFKDYPKFSFDVLVRPVEELPENVLADSKEVEIIMFKDFFNFCFF
jgi:hypothetical protein